MKTMFEQMAEGDSFRHEGWKIGGWQPIETAPKDGTVVLGWPTYGQYNAVMPAPMVWDRKQHNWRNAVSEGEWMGLPSWHDDGPSKVTHWMPLPAPPATARSD